MNAKTAFLFWFRLSEYKVDIVASGACNFLSLLA